MKNQTLTRYLIQLSWWKFIAIALISVLFIAFLISPFYLAFEPTIDSIRSGLVYSLTAMVGADQGQEFSGFGLVVLSVQRVLSLIWFSLFTALVFARVSENRNKSYLAPRIACYLDDGFAHVPQRSCCALLEFRLIVHPNAPIIRPQIAVTLHAKNLRGERNHSPLELTPFQPCMVKYYLTFRAVIPSEFLVLADDDRLETSRKLPTGVVEVFVSGIDSGSDHPINIYKEYELPYEVRSGRFVDAVELDGNGSIINLRASMLHKIEPDE